MNKRKKTYLRVLLFMGVVYTVLLALLYVSESANDSSSIQTFGDAFWYSIVTLSTVGYGDLVPITPLGQAIGVLFFGL